MAASASFLRKLRLVHLYVGVFTAPALLFFALTGALQTFSLHETTRGSSYQPPHWIEVLAQIHKKQTAVMPPPRSGPPPRVSRPEPPGDRPPAAGAAPTSAPAEAPERNPVPLKIFFLVVSIGLFASTLSGVWMSYAYQRNKRLVTALLLLGAVLPIVLVFV